MKNIEIEIQVKIENIKPLLIFLKKSGQFKSEEKQIDQYFTPAHRDFLAVRPVKEWLRLRNSNGVYSVNYKNWQYNKKGEGLYAEEYETKIADLEKVKSIFQILNFKKLINVDKKRKIWNYKNWEISLDSVKGLGDFVEIEFIGKNRKDPKKIMIEMINFLKELGCGKIEENHVGYPFLLLGNRR
ncbi:MAG: class IV adenylate cyclase [Patescibacteria group bacterium]